MGVAESDTRPSEGVLENILEQNVNPIIPPYPQNYKIPDFLKRFWVRKKCNGLYVPILRNVNFGEILSLGSQFNAIVMSKKRKKGLKSPNRCHRVYQFLDKPNRLSGHVVFNDSYSGEDVLKKGDVRMGMVYRFEVVKIKEKRKIFYCVPLRKIMTKGDFISCNYK